MGVHEILLKVDNAFWIRFFSSWFFHRRRFFDCWRMSANVPMEASSSPLIPGHKEGDPFLVFQDVDPASGHSRSPRFARDDKPLLATAAAALSFRPARRYLSSFKIIDYVIYSFEGGRKGEGEGARGGPSAAGCFGTG
jgi:hypothetical protein